MSLSQTAYRATVCALWALGVWNAWECLGLYSDGSLFMIQSVRRMSFWVFDPARDYIYGLTQIPLVIALHLGVTDLHWLARVYSIGLIVVPTSLYHLALIRAKSDTILLAVTIAVVAMVFMTTSFFIEGEYNAAFAIGILIAIWLATADKLRMADGVVLVLVATFALRMYEIFLYLGPLLAGMTAWTAHRGWLQSGGQGNRLVLPMAIIALAAIFLAWWDTYAILFCLPPLVVAGIFWGRHRPESRTSLAAGLYLLAAALLLAGSVIAADSLVRRLSFLVDTVWSARGSWHNAQLILLLSAASVVVIWGLVRPNDLRRRRPYALACCILALLALSPLLAQQIPWLRPDPSAHYEARNAAGLVTAAAVAFIAVRMFRDGAWFAGLTILKNPPVARNLLAFSSLMLLAVLPSSISMTTHWISFLEAMRTTVRTHQGVVPVADTALSRPPHVFFADPEFLISLSLALRATPGDGILVAPDFHTALMPTELPDLGPFFWRD